MNLAIINHSEGEGPFDAIRRFDGDGNEYWTARELMKPLGYTTWRRFEGAIERAKISCQNMNNNVDFHFATSGKMGEIGGSGNLRELEDYRLTRYGSYLIAMNGDPRKPEIAAAQSYFAVKTYEAEKVIPLQLQEIERLKLEAENLRLENENLKLLAEVESTRLKQIESQIELKRTELKKVSSQFKTPKKNKQSKPQHVERVSQDKILLDTVIWLKIQYEKPPTTRDIASKLKTASFIIAQHLQNLHSRGLVNRSEKPLGEDGFQWWVDLDFYQSHAHLL